MARTFAERVELWEARIETYRSQRSLALMRATGDLSPFSSWLGTLALAVDILAELETQKEQADGYQASRDLIRERLEFAQREGSEALMRLSWLEENARRLRSYVEEKATCPRCGRWDECEDGCEFFDHRCGEDMPSYQRGVLEAREALGGFAL